MDEGYISSLEKKRKKEISYVSMGSVSDIDDEPINFNKYD